MNKLQRCVLGLYSYDDRAEDLSLENILNQSINLIASMPTMMVNAYQMKRRYYDKQSMFCLLYTSVQRHWQSRAQTTAPFWRTTTPAPNCGGNSRGKIILNFVVQNRLRAILNYFFAEKS